MNHQWRQSGGSGVSNGGQPELQTVTGRQWLLALDRRLGAPISSIGGVSVRVQIIRFWMHRCAAALLAILAAVAFCVIAIAVGLAPWHSSHRPVLRIAFPVPGRPDPAVDPDFADSIQPAKYLPIPLQLQPPP